MKDVLFLWHGITPKRKHMSLKFCTNLSWKLLKGIQLNAATQTKRALPLSCFLFKQIQGTQVKDMFDSCGIKVSAFHDPEQNHNCSQTLLTFDPNKGCEGGNGRKNKNRIRHFKAHKRITTQHEKCDCFAFLLSVVFIDVFIQCNKRRRRRKEKQHPAGELTVIVAHV